MRQSPQQINITTSAAEVHPESDVATAPVMLPQFCYPLMAAVALVWAGRVFKKNYAEARSMVTVFREAGAKQKNGTDSTG